MTLTKRMISAAMLLVSIVAMAQDYQAVDLRCDHVKNPLGIDNALPRLSWRLDAGNAQGARQTAYQIMVDTDADKVKQGEGNMWKTAKVSSDNMLVVYDGKPLQPFTKYYWKVNVWNEDGKLSTSEVNSFETAMMCQYNWKGAWIFDKKDRDFRPAPYYRKTFSTAKPIKAARAYVAAAGLFELYVNGEKIGDHLLDPLYTRFDKRNLYVTLDVTDQLRQGKNAIGVILGNGWYNHQSLATWWFENASWRCRPQFCMDLRITYADGQVETIRTNNTWKTSADGPLLSNSIYTGEVYDFRLEDKDWSTPDYDDSKWRGISQWCHAPSGNIAAQVADPIRAVETLPAVSLNKIDEQTYVFDFGQNISGVTKLRIKGDEGTVIKLKHGERLYDDGRVNISNLDVYFRDKDTGRDPFGTDIVTLSGKGMDEFMPKFNYKGFRYVELTTSKPMPVEKENLTAYFVHSDVEPVGELTTSSELINKIWKATNYAYLSNLMGYPTDCPQREKNGWTGDAQLAIETALYNFDGITTYEKWMADHQDEQQPNGELPDIVPTYGWGYGGDNGLDWTSTIAVIPWNIYLFYGDSNLLRSCYNNIKRYLNYVESISNEDGLTNWGRGDWLRVKGSGAIPKEFISSTYLYVDASILARAAKMFGKDDDYEYYTALANKVRNAINRKYLDEATGKYHNGLQTEQGLAIMWGIVPEEVKAKAVARLVEAVKAEDYHLDAGILGTKTILNALSENGEFDTAYKLATQTTFPSWGNWIVNGNTTLMENWDLNAKRDISDNHICFGEIGAWLYKGIGGIFPDKEQPGFKHTILRPNFPAELTHFSARHRSPYGDVSSSWTRKGKKITYKVVVPANATATLTLPDYVKAAQYTHELKAGEYSFEFRLK